MKIDPAFVTTLGFAIVLTATATQFAKQAIELVLDPVKQKAGHDLAVQGAAILIGIGSVVGLSMAFGPGVATLRLGAMAVLIGLAVGFSASGQYALLTALVKVAEGQPAVSVAAPNPVPVVPVIAETKPTPVLPPETPAA